jgi:peptidoglycan/xylan/chitin deacetylase (PgdA/CDA1 family)
LSTETLVEELAGSRAALEKALGSPVTGFCYPYGTVDRPAAEAVSQEYEYGCAIAATIADRWTLPRFHVGERDGKLRLLAKLGLRPVRERRQSRSSRTMSTSKA